MPAVSVSDEPLEPSLNISLHIRYWMRCLKTLLPTGYQEQDSSRIILGFFILSSLDILGGLDQHITSEERTSFITFIYRCQHPGGGFRSFPGTDFGDGHRTKENRRWDPANVAGTYFALAALLILGDDLSKVNRKEILSWIRNLQREDGSFGEIASGGDAIVEGGQDVRFCFLAVLICVLLGEQRGSSRHDIESIIDAEALTRFILDSQAYDGGMARKPKCESHAGSTYCGISTLKLLERLPASETAATETSIPQKASSEFVESLLYWLSHRQTTMLSDYQDFNTLEEQDSSGEQATKQNTSDKSAVTVLNATLALPPDILSFESLTLDNDISTIAGMNGRVNKPADTCYSFWVGATLAVRIYPHNTMYLKLTSSRYVAIQSLWTEMLIGGTYSQRRSIELADLGNSQAISLVSLLAGRIFLRERVN